MKTCIVAALALVAAGAFADTPNKAYEIWPKGKIPLAKENPKPEMPFTAVLPTCKKAQPGLPARNTMFRKH